MSAKKTAGWAAIVVAFLGTAEGVRQYAYRDSVGVPTVCIGETKGVHMGDHYTVEQCNQMLTKRVEEFDAAAMKCIRVPMSENRRAAVVSFSYNVGTSAFCHSGFARRLNAGDPKACDELLKWNKAGGRVLQGLVSRRKKERELCLG